MVTLTIWRLPDRFCRPNTTTLQCSTRIGGEWMYDQAVKLRDADYGLAIGGRLSTAAEPVDSRRDVRPILSDRCFACHGPTSRRAKPACGSIRKRGEGGARAAHTIVPGIRLRVR